ncbi:MAG: TonB-dependent receptor, partial [Bryobacterales bacterium]|nr:TonB-dependent receptor [Bryobacterales bacterium]
LVTSNAVAQSPRGTISGVAKDSSGSPLQGARVQLDPAGRQAVTDNQGQFRISDVPAGDYTLGVSYVGFASFSTKLVVDTNGQAPSVNAVLNVVSQSDRVLVTGERVQGEAEAINIERTADNILQVLPSRVITSLPNTNIADAVGRLPSVTLERDEGEGKYVQIRGTEPRLSNVTINGVHVPSPEGNVRNIKLDIVPSDIVDRIEVNKTLSPNQDADAIGGSVNLVTKTPGEKPTYTFGVQGGYTPIQGGRSLNGFNGTVGQRFGVSKKLGVLLGGSYDKNNRGIDDLEPSQAIGNYNGNNFAYISSEDLRTYQYDRTRYGFNGDVDYNVRPGWTVYLKGLQADFHDYGNTFVYTPNAGSILSHNGAQTTFDNSGNMQFREYIRRPDQGVFSIAAGSTNVISSYVITYQFAVSRGHNYGGQDFATTNFSGPSNVQFGLNEANPLRPSLTSLDGTNVYDPSAYSITSTVIPYYHSAELDYQGSVNISHIYNLGSHSSTFQTGFEVRDAHKTQNENDHFYNAVGTYTMAQALGGGSNSNYYDKSFVYGPLTDYGKIQTLINGALQSGFTANLDKNHIVSDPATWDAGERIYAGYLMDSITFGKLRVQGGLRIEATGTNFHANKVTLNGGAYDHTDHVTGNSGYINLMPSVQAQYLITSNTNLRLSYGRGISRPNFQDIVPSVQVDPNTSPKSLQLGNPSLLPTRANNYDVLIEHYFQPLGILQGGFFYKDLSDPIYPTISFVPASDPNFAGYLRQQSINGPSAHIAGFEMSWQQRLSFLPGLLSGFGVSANYSYATSRVTFPTGFSSAVPGGEGRVDHPGLQRQAPNTWNLGFTYDKSRLSMRFGVSHNDASIFAYGYVHDPTIPNVDRDPILGIKGPLGDQHLYAHTQVDIQGSYRIYKGLQFVASGLNLTNEVFGFYTGSPIYPNQREYYHPTLILGMRWVSALERN